MPKMRRAPALGRRCAALSAEAEAGEHVAADLRARLAAAEHTCSETRGWPARQAVDDALAAVAQRMTAMLDSGLAHIRQRYDELLGSCLRLQADGATTSVVADAAVGAATVAGVGSPAGALRESAGACACALIPGAVEALDASVAVSTGGREQQPDERGRAKLRLHSVHAVDERCRSSGCGASHVFARLVAPAHLRPVCRAVGITDVDGGHFCG